MQAGLFGWKCRKWRKEKRISFSQEILYSDLLPSGRTKPRTPVRQVEISLPLSLWNNSLSLSAVLQIVIPFFSLLIKDLYFLNEGCANRLQNGHINFEVCWILNSPEGVSRATDFYTLSKHHHSLHMATDLLPFVSISLKRGSKNEEVGSVSVEQHSDLKLYFHWCWVTQLHWLRDYFKDEELLMAFSVLT